MDYIHKNNINDLITGTCNALFNFGEEIPSRNGPTIELINPTLELGDPRYRHLYLEGRKNNIYATIAETFWVMAGQDELDPLMKFFLKRSPDFSDDGGKTWRGAYGKRIFNYGQVENVVELFRRGGKNTRQAVMSIWQPELDTYDSIHSEYNLLETKDKPCNNFIWFWCRENSLSMKVGIRSNDLIWGASAINIFEWTFLQEFMLRILQNEIPEEFKDVKLGSYIHNPISLHIYDFTVQQAKDISKLNETDTHELLAVDDMDIGALNIKSYRSFFTELYHNFCAWIEGNNKTTVSELFQAWDVPMGRNQLYNYAWLVERYIEWKKGYEPKPVEAVLCKDLYQAISKSRFGPYKDWDKK